MKQKKKYRVAASILSIILLMTNVIFDIMLFRMNLLPTGWMVAIAVVLFLISFLLVVAIIRKKKGFWLKAMILILLSICLGAASYYMYGLGSMLAKITQPVIQTDAVSAYVLKESKAENIQDTEDMQFGILTEVDRANTDKTILELEDKTGFSLDYAEYDDMLSMADALYDGEVDVIILNDSFVELIGEIEGYESFGEDIRALVTTVQETVLPVEEATKEMEDFFVIYLSGIDTYGGVANKSRSDVNILAAVNLETKQVLLLSTPRDYYVELPISNGNRDKLTHAGMYGVDVSMGTLEDIYDIDVNYFVRMNFSGFIDIIDALGGIEVYSEYNFTVEPVMTYQKGYNHVNGIQALAFARERHSFSAGDNQRGKNQMEVIKAVVNKCMSPAILTGYGDLLDSIAGSFETNFTEDEISFLVKEVLSEGGGFEILSHSVVGSNSKNYTYSLPSTYTYVMEPDMESIEAAKDLLEQMSSGGRISISE